jgi:hypothetical protein
MSSNPAQARCTPVSSTYKTNRHDMAEISLKVSLNTINQTKPYVFLSEYWPTEKKPVPI